MNKSMLVKLSDIKNNPDNPRVLKDDKLAKLVESILDFPKMLEIRPIVINDDMMILGGNMRLKACQEAGLKEVPVIKASDFTEEEQSKFIIKDNVGSGEWDWEILGDDWDAETLKGWGVELPFPDEDVDYSILDDDLESELDALEGGVKKAIQIEFEAHDYKQALEMVKKYRDSGAYIGGIFLQHLLERQGELS